MTPKTLSITGTVSFEHVGFFAVIFSLYSHAFIFGSAPFKLAPVTVVSFRAHANIVELSHRIAEAIITP